MITHRGFPCGSAGKESACNAGDLGSIPGLGRSPGDGKGNPPKYSGLENSMDCIVHGVTKSWTRLSDFHFLSLSLATGALLISFSRTSGLYTQGMHRSFIFCSKKGCPVLCSWGIWCWLDDLMPSRKLYLSLVGVMDRVLFSPCQLSVIDRGDDLSIP